MKSALAASALLTHYQGSDLTVAMCWRVELTDGTLYGFTAHDRDIVHDGLTYIASSGFEPSAAEGRNRLAVDNAELKGLFDSDVILLDDLAAGAWDYARVQVLLLNWADPAQGADVLMTGRLGRLSIEAGTYTAELRGLAAAYEPAVGQLYQPSCRAVFGDARCGVDLAPWTVTGTVTGVSDTRQVLFDTSRTEPGPPSAKDITGITQAFPAVVTCPAHGFAAHQVVYIAGVAGMFNINGQYYVVKQVLDADRFSLEGVDSRTWQAYAGGGSVSEQGAVGYFDYGTLTMTSGAAAGLTGEVKAYGVGTITLQVEFPRDVAVGDTYSMTAGCGKRFSEDCVARFGNGINFRGEPFLPGMDRVLKVGDQ